MLALHLSRKSWTKVCQKRIPKATFNQLSHEDGPINLLSSAHLTVFKAILPPWTMSRFQVSPNSRKNSFLFLLSSVQLSLRSFVWNQRYASPLQLLSFGVSDVNQVSRGPSSRIQEPAVYPLNLEGLGYEVEFWSSKEVFPLAHLPPILWTVVCHNLADLDRRSLGLTCRRMAFILTSFVGLEVSHFSTSEAPGEWMNEFILHDRVNRFVSPKFGLRIW